MNYYNEIDPFCCEWLRNLIEKDLLPDGIVDERPIEEVDSADLKGFNQCHFFAGIGGWPLALGMAGIPSDFPVWTGSCPCQPFSVAGKRKGAEDERHLWPIFSNLITERRPQLVFGEQVSGKGGLEWLSRVRIDLEAGGYAVGGADLPAASVGAPHKRQRLFWVAHSRHQRRWCNQAGEISGMGEKGRTGEASNSSIKSMGNANSEGLEKREGKPGDDEKEIGKDSGEATLKAGNSNRMEYAHGHGFDGKGLHIRQDARRRAEEAFGESWHIECGDGKQRRIEPGICPLADGIPGRVGQLRAYGNAIVPQVAAIFIEASIMAILDSQ